MSTKKIKIAVFGETLQTNEALLDKLKKGFNVFICTDLYELANKIELKKINFLLLEIGPSGKELKILKQLQDQFPKLQVITLGLEKPQQNLINSFKYGSNDFFKLPINVDLLIERIVGIVRSSEYKE